MGSLFVGSGYACTGSGASRCDVGPLFGAHPRRHSYGELQVYVHDMWKVSIGPADDLAPPAPQLILTGQVGEATESRLATITRRVVRLEATAFWVDDGSGPARVNFVSTTGLRRPAVRRGETWTATGV